VLPLARPNWYLIPPRRAGYPVVDPSKLENFALGATETTFNGWQTVSVGGGSTPYGDILRLFNVYYNPGSRVPGSGDCSPTALVHPETPGSAPSLLLVAQNTSSPQKPAGPPLRRGERVPPHHVVVQPAKFYVRMSMTPGKVERTAEISVWAEDLQGKRLALKQAPALKIKHVGHKEELKAPLRPALQANGYTVALAQLPLDVEISIQATATDPQGHTEEATERFEMSRPDPGKASEIFSADGQLALKLPSKALAPGARVSIGPSTILLPKLESGETLASSPFRVASDQPGTLARSATVEFRLPRDGDAIEYDLKSFVILVYDSATAKWTRQPGVVHPSPLNIIAFKTQRLGTFALVARPAPGK